eukprot:TRINITY_DN54328_c0_g1_i1.p1 TRINITY_DN54328_c0_g1~~TRINITY_DN54328_c0_g1_i1.p1  ORF type:complete len:718 (+),score=118.74 TRINITY_DN54328_c0_g1_i1:56-2155(+)
MGARQSCHKACSNCAADCTRADRGLGDDVDEERPGGDPAGATFEETLEDLNSLDRHLMLFCATSNLSAVRWLLHLGAHWDASDANSTTCLHVACRSGALAIVKEMIGYKELLQSTDVAGWCALHIAVLMGRREVVVRLLRAGAKSNLRNAKGQLPTELCADNGTYEALRSYEMHQVQNPTKEWEYTAETGQGEDIIGSRLQYEPFFVPRQPVVRGSSCQQYKKEFQKIGTLMFNRMPGYGLGFLVASGVTRDYPVDMSTFLRRSRVDIRQVGSFLGEAYSLSHTIRLEFINSAVLQNTGVVSALVQVCRMLQLPDDLQKINRLVHGVARIWWRQHERLLKSLAGSVVPPAKQNAAQASYPDELVGLELKQYITSSDALHQLMFSTVLLHWYIYKDGQGTQREMSYALWKKLNSGIEAGGTDIPEHVQLQVHKLICQQFIPELAVATASRSGESGNNRSHLGGGPDDAGGGSNDHQWEGNIASERPRGSSWAPSASLEGWTQLVGGTFPKPTGLAGVQSVSYQHMSSIFSEVTTSLGVGTTALGIGRDEVMPTGPRGNDFVWLSLCYTLLFFSAHPSTGAPYAFVELSKVRVQTVQHEARTLTLVGSPDADDDAGADGTAAAASANGAGADGSKGTAPVCIVLLLPDGRWQELSLQRLEFRFSVAGELLTWSNHLVAATRGSQGQAIKGTGVPPKPTGGR